jgi:hypothetical protein
VPFESTAKGRGRLGSCVITRGSLDTKEVDNWLTSDIKSTTTCSDDIVHQEGEKSKLRRFAGSPRKRCCQRASGQRRTIILLLGQGGGVAEVAVTGVQLEQQRLVGKHRLVR